MIEGIKYNKITLAFAPREERVFRKSYFDNSLRQLRVALVFITLLYGGFGVLDTKMFPEFAHLFHIIRYLVVVPLILATIFLSYFRIFEKIWQVTLFVCTLIGGGGISLMILHVPDNYAYYPGLILIVMATYFFIKLRFFLATIAGWATIIIFNVLMYFSDADILLIINNNFFYVSANIIGMFAAYSIEYNIRRNFLLTHHLRAERETIHTLNKELENKVKERTQEFLKAKDKAEESDRLKSSFLANMSHEIRTPMNGILGFADLLKDPEIDESIQQEYIGIIEASGERLLSIVNNIVDISKIETGQMPVRLEESDINEQMDYVYTFFLPKMEAKGIKLSIQKSLYGDEAVINTDREKVFAVLTNLVNNAMKFTSEGEISIGYELNNDLLTFYVQDTGIGIPAEEKDAIFERFIQVESQHRADQQGTGLGLSITRAYITMLGGEIWVESTPGIGSKFCFTLPRLDKSA